LKLIDVFIRSFSKQPASPAEGLSSVDAIASVIAYGQDDQVKTIRERLQETNAPFILFIDDIIPFESIDWDGLVNTALSRPGTALTPACKGLRSVYGINGEGNSKKLPSWFCLLPREKVMALPELYETLDFFLLSLACRDDISLQTDGLSPLIFDTAEWAGKLIMGSAEALAKDYCSFAVNEGPDAPGFIPPQFRVSTNHSPAILGLPGEDQYHTEYPRFSLICPVFKSDFLEEMIDSVLAQTWPHWELLIGVDGPPAAEEEKILALLSLQADPRISYFLQENKGTGPTRKLLSEQASGDFIFSIDDDDMLLPDSLRVFAGAIGCNPDTKVFRGSTRITGLVECDLPARKRFLVNGISNDPFEVNQPYVIETKLLHSAGGYVWDTRLHNAGEDTFLFHKLDQEGIPVKMLPVPLYLRRLSTKNLTLQFKVNEAMDHFRNIDERFTPQGWQNTDRRFVLDGNFQRAFASYGQEEGTMAVTTATRFFQYQTLGDLETMTIDLEVTARCNAVCGFCPRDVMPDTKTHISLETVRSLAGNLRNGPQKQVVLCGIGESLLHPEIEQIIRILTQAGAYVAMTSNGALMTEKTFRKLVSAGLKSVNFSVNAASAATHQTVMGMKNYEKVVANVQRVLEIKEEIFPSMRVHVSCVVCEQNEQEVELFVEQWRKKPVTQIWLHPVNNRAGLLVAHIKSVRINRFFEQYAGDPRVAVDIFKDHEEKSNLCKIAKHLAFISSDGNMRLCAMDYQRVTSYGNINDKSLQQLHFEKLLSFIRGEHQDLCQHCDFCPKELKQKNTTNTREYALGGIM
jgi:MoaA/NifB/PqqE/SkfB family radical SAM enzyme/glycosyltransferase involved in cell wall biosynthesis